MPHNASPAIENTETVVDTAEIAASTPYEELFARVLDPAVRHDPYPLYAALRSRRVGQQADGNWVVSGYDEIAILLHDPRVSSEMRHAGHPVSHGTDKSILVTDPPKHDRLRGAVMSKFTPPLLESVRDEIRGLTDMLLDGLGERTRLDLVDEVSYPLPVSVICKLLGVPPEDEPKFHVWADAIARALDLDPSLSPEELAATDDAAAELGGYLEKLAADRRQHPREDLISGLIADAEGSRPISAEELIITLRLLLIAGHETTVNLITNGMLTLLRNPDVLARFRNEPGLVVPMVEEIVRFEPSVQFRYRAALADIEIGGVTIPKGSQMTLLLAGGSRDPEHFTDPDRFVPDRTPNQHFGFGGGIHYCIGAPLARMEAQIVLPELVRRLANPRLVADVPPYRPTAALRGVRHLWLDVDRVAS